MSFRHAVIWFLIVLALISCTKQVEPRQHRVELFVKRLYLLHPWTTSTRYQTKDWDKVIHLACDMQKEEPGTVEQVLNEFTKRNKDNFKGTYEEESKPFLLLRVMFDLPKSGKPTGRFSFKGWRRFDLNDHRFDADINSDGSVNLGWPVGWNGSSPFLTCPYSGSEGPPYTAADEFRFMLKRFKYRELDTK